MSITPNLPVARLEPDAPALDPTQPFLCVPIFTGYPYLVTLIGSSPFRHLILIPADRTEDDLAVLAERQVRANQLDTSLYLGPDSALSFRPAGTHVRASDLPWGVPVRRWLLPSEDFPATEELERREDALKRFVDRFPFRELTIHDPLSDGWLATPDDLERLGARNESARHDGLRRCSTCHELRGEWLALNREGNGDPRPRVVFAHCACDNRTCCARCGRPLATGRLSSFRFDETKAGGGVVFTHAFQCSGHRCPNGRKP